MFFLEYIQFKNNEESAGPINGQRILFSRFLVDIEMAHTRYATRARRNELTPHKKESDTYKN